MKYNKTSDAVEQAITFMKETNAYRVGCGISIPVMCLEKYHRMERALQTLAGVHSAPDEGDGTDSYVRGVAEEALSFDPLSDD